MSIRNAIRVLLHSDEWFHVQEIHDYCRTRFRKWEKEERLQAMPDEMSYEDNLEELQRTTEAEGKKMEALRIGQHFADQVNYRNLALSRDYADKGDEH